MEKTTKTGLMDNAQLLSHYLTQEMEAYFYKKLSQENPQYIKMKICELLKYFSICHFSPGDIPFNSEIDELWHLWILQTREYSELMRKLPSGQFIHHSSYDYENNEEEQNEEQKINRQVSFLASYYYNFGEFTEGTIKFWPITACLMKVLNLSVADLNQYLSKFAASKALDYYL